MTKQLLWTVLILCMSYSGAVTYAYDGDNHQQLTFIAAKHFNHCAEMVGADRYTPLQVRYVTKANAREADGGFWRKLIRWDYYDRKSQSDRNFLWLFETRLHGHYRVLLERLRSNKNPSTQYSNLGRVISHIQDMSTPSHAVPVFAGRWWRFSTADRFEDYPVENELLVSAIENDCSAVSQVLSGGSEFDFETLLTITAQNTIKAVQEGVPGMPISWEAFWQLDQNPGSFGEYGIAGNNFGRQTEFDCGVVDGEVCVLLPNDPLYLDFAFQRHLDAVRSTVLAMALLQNAAVDE